MKKLLFILSIFVAIFFLAVAVKFVFKKKPEVTCELKEELSEQPLKIRGEIPNWLSGTLVRNGPTRFNIKGKGDSGHFFDGLAMLHAFTIHNGEVVYSNKFLQTDSYRAVFEEGELPYNGFARDPCRSIFRKFFTWFYNKSGPNLVNANVNVAKLLDQYVALTEIPLPVQFDLKTLDTLGVLNYQDELPKENCWESAHPCYDSDTKETINYLIKYGKESYYTIYKIKDDSVSRDVIAEVQVEEPAYMHSFSITPNYVILTEYPFVVKPLDLITKNKAFISNFHWKPEIGTQFIVISRETGEVIGKYKTKPFFAFHHVNAYEDIDKTANKIYQKTKDNGFVSGGMPTNLYIDIITYKNADVIMNVGKPSSKKDSERLERFKISLTTGEIDSEMLFQGPCELPRINEQIRGQKYHYVYLTDFTSKPRENIRKALYKVNTETKEVQTWRRKGCFPGEPQFVLSPNAKEEDDGVVLTVVLDFKNKTSFLLVLDAKTFQEIGRAYAPHQIPVGLHSQFFEQFQ